MTPGWSVWAGAVGATIAVDDQEPWTVTDCSPLTQAGGWRTWRVTLRSPEAVDQGTFVLHLPEGDPEPVFAVPAARDEQGTTLVAAFSHLDPS